MCCLSGDFLRSQKFTCTVLSPSTEELVAYCVTAWYTDIVVLLFAPPTLVFSSFYFLLTSTLGSPIFHTTDSHSVSAGLTLLFVYNAILVFFYGWSGPCNEPCHLVLTVSSSLSHPQSVPCSWSIIQMFSASPNLPPYSHFVYVQ